MNGKKQLLDPLSIVCKLVELNFDESDTKLSIQDHILMIQKPHALVGLVRSCYGDGRENISDLYDAITRVIQWYLVCDVGESDKNTIILYNPHKIYENNIANSNELKRMISYMCDALIKLQNTYKNGNVVLALQFYINILRDGLNGKFDNSYLPKCMESMNITNLLDYKKIKNKWSYESFIRICELYDKCFEVSRDIYKTDQQKTDYISSYLKSINNLLEIEDKKFRELVLNSEKG